MDHYRATGANTSNRQSEVVSTRYMQYGNSPNDTHRTVEGDEGVLERNACDALRGRLDVPQITDMSLLRRIARRAVRNFEGVEVGSSGNATVAQVARRARRRGRMSRGKATNKRDARTH